MSARVVFMGSPEFAVPSLRALAKAGYSIELVVTQPDKPAGRGGRMQAPPVKLAAEELGVSVYQPESLRNEEAQEKLQEPQAAVFVVAAYGKILPQAVLDIPKRGCVNVHGSLLPKWRGPSPIVASLLAGEAETGVSIMELVRKMDAGPVISRLAIPIAADDTAATLEPRMAAAGAEELVRVLPGWLAGTLQARAQDEDQATYCHLVTKQDGHLRAGWPVSQAERAVRAYNPWPGAFVLFKGDRLGIWKAHVTAGESAVAGTMATIERLPAIAFEGGWLVLDEVQKPGGKRISAQQFLAGERGELPPTVGLA